MCEKVEIAAYKRCNIYWKVPEYNEKRNHSNSSFREQRTKKYAFFFAELLAELKVRILWISPEELKLVRLFYVIKMIIEKQTCFY